MGAGGKPTVSNQPTQGTIFILRLFVCRPQSNLGCLRLTVEFWTLEKARLRSFAATRASRGE